MRQAAKPFGGIIDETLWRLQARGNNSYDPDAGVYTKLNGTKFYCTPSEMRNFAPIEIEVFSEVECDRILLARTGAKREPRKVERIEPPKPLSWWAKLKARFYRIDERYLAKEGDLIIYTDGTTP